MPRRAPRACADDGTVTKITVDEAIDRRRRIRQLLVPHNNGPFEGAVDSGTVYTVYP